MAVSNAFLSAHEEWLRKQKRESRRSRQEVTTQSIRLKPESSPILITQKNKKYLRVRNGWVRKQQLLWHKILYFKTDIENYNAL